MGLSKDMGSFLLQEQQGTAWSTTLICHIPDFSYIPSSIKALFSDYPFSDYFFGQVARFKQYTLAKTLNQVKNMFASFMNFSLFMAHKKYYKI